MSVAARLELSSADHQSGMRRTATDLQVYNEIIPVYPFCWQSPWKGRLMVAVLPQAGYRPVHHRQPLKNGLRLDHLVHPFHGFGQPIRLGSQ